MNKTSKIMSILLALVIVLTSIGCAAEASLVDEAQMVKHLNKFLLKKNLILATEKVDSVKVEERTTNKSKTEDEIICNVEITDDGGVYKYVRQYILYYDKNTEKEWDFSKASAYKEDKWKVAPIKGVSDEDVKKYILANNVSIDGSYWYFYDEELSGFVVTRETDIENGKDVCIAKFQVEYAVQIASFEIKIPYAFNESYTSYEWKADYDKVEAKAEFTYIKGKELDLSQEGVSKDISKSEKIYFGSGSNKQTVVANKDNVKNYKLDSNIIGNYGTSQNAKCSFDITNGLININVKADITYDYEDEWQAKYIFIDSEISVIDMKGIWKGTYDVNKDITIEITEFVDGYVKGKITYEKGTLDIDSSFSNYSLSFDLPYDYPDMYDFAWGNAYLQFNDASFKMEYDDETIVLAKQ